MAKAVKTRAAGVIGVAAVGLVVGLVVAAAATASGIVGCSQDPSGECHALARTLSVRVGLVAGLAAIMMLLVVVGLLRMVAHDERHREEAPASLWE